MNRARWIAAASGVLAGLGLHPTAEAGGGSSGSTSGEATEASGSETAGSDSSTTAEASTGDDASTSTGTGSLDGSTTQVGPCLVPLDESSISACLADGGSEILDDAGDDPATGPCLSISPPSDGCTCGPTDDPAAPLTLLLPALALRRRGGRRDRLDLFAGTGRLPPDVIARLRARLDDD